MNECYENTLRKGRTFIAGLNDVTLARVPWNRTKRAGQVCTPCCGVHDSHFDCLMLIT